MELKYFKLAMFALALLFLISGLPAKAEQIGLSSASKKPANTGAAKRKRIRRRICKGILLWRKRSKCDADKDGIRNRKELILGTDPYNRDSDTDGLTDGAELLTFESNPLDYDTDDDGISDGDEDNNFNGISDEDEDDLPAEGNTAEDLDDPTTPGGSSNPGNGNGPGAGGGTGPNSCVLSPYDANGNTNSFGIPAGLSGNITSGNGQFNTTCKRCHAIDKGVNLAFAQLKGAVTGPPMNITTLSDQNFADLVSYLNRSKDNGVRVCPTPDPGAGPVPTPMPTATPTPLDDRSAGQLVFQGTCQACHSNARQFRNLTRAKLEEAIAEKPQMRGITLTEEEYRVLFIYFRSLL